MAETKKERKPVRKTEARAEQKQELKEIEIPSDLASKAEEFRGKLIEAVADFSDELKNHIRNILNYN